MCKGELGQDDGSRWFIIRNGCRSIWCPRCGPGRGVKLAHRLHERYLLKRVGRVGFATLTCSPSVLGDDLQAQFERVKAERLVSRFVRLFCKLVGRKVDYFSVMEFQGRSQQIHFHLMLDNEGRLNRRTLRLLQAWCQ